MLCVSDSFITFVWPVQDAVLAEGAKQTSNEDQAASDTLNGSQCPVDTIQPHKHAGKGELIAPTSSNCGDGDQLDPVVNEMSTAPGSLDLFGKEADLDPSSTVIRNNRPIPTPSHQAPTRPLMLKGITLPVHVFEQHWHT